LPELLIRKLACRDDLSEAEVNRMRSMVSGTRLVAARTDLASYGDRVNHSTLLQEGLVIRYRTLATGGRQILAIHVPGDFVDFQSFLLKVMDHSIAALSPCKVASVPHAVLHQITEEMPHLARLFATSGLIDAAINREWLLAMGRQNALARIAHLFCELYVRLSVVGLSAKYGFSIPLRQIDLADAVGLSTVHVNRSIQALRTRGLLEWTGDRIELRNWPALVALAEFNPIYLHLDRYPR
jgi:CRP-like cAMP-binding protein